MFAGQLGYKQSRFGGARHCFSDPTGMEILLIGGQVKEERLPLAGNRLPSGTPLLYDSDAKTIDVFYAFRVTEAVEAAGTSVKVEKIMNNTIAKVGMVVMKMPTTVTATGTGVTITAIDKSEEDFDTITLSAAVGTLAVGDVLVEASAAGSSARIKVLPNCMSYYDLELLPGFQLTMIPFNGMWALWHGEVYERRISPVPDVIKTYMQTNPGLPCIFRYTQAQE